MSGAVSVFRRLASWRGRRAASLAVPVVLPPGRVERIAAMLDPEIAREDLDAAIAAASREEKADARALMDVAGELIIERQRLLELQLAFLIGGDEWR